MPKGDNTGGRRPGAGRKPKDDKREQVTLYVTPSTSRMIDNLREHNYNIRDEFEEFVYQLYVSTGLAAAEFEDTEPF